MHLGAQRAPQQIRHQHTNKHTHTLLQTTRLRAYMSIFFGYYVARVAPRKGQRQRRSLGLRLRACMCPLEIHTHKAQPTCSLPMVSYTTQVSTHPFHDPPTPLRSSVTLPRPIGRSTDFFLIPTLKHRLTTVSIWAICSSLGAPWATWQQWTLVSCWGLLCGLVGRPWGNIER